MDKSYWTVLWQVYSDPSVIMQRPRIMFDLKSLFFSKITVQDLTEINPFMPENARKNENGEIVKMANKAVQSLVGISTFLLTSPATNKSMQMTSYRQAGFLCKWQYGEFDECGNFGGCGELIDMLSADQHGEIFSCILLMLNLCWLKRNFKVYSVVSITVSIASC